MSLGPFPANRRTVFAELNEVSPFVASGEINCQLLPPGAYTFSWRIRLNKPPWFDNTPVHFTLFKNDVLVDERKCVLSKSYLRVEHFKVPTIRIVENGWREYDIGEFVVESGDSRSCHLKFSVQGDATYCISLDGVVVQPTRGLHVGSSVDCQKALAPIATEKLSIPQESHLCDLFYAYFPSLPTCQMRTTLGEECFTCPAETPMWRALVDSEVGLECCLRKTVKPSTDITSSLSVYLSLTTFLEQYGQAIRAQEQGDWKSAQYNFSELRRDIVCSVGKFEKRDYDLLLAWIDNPLAQLFQSEGGPDMLRSAMNLREEMLECVMPMRGSHESLVRVCETYFYTAQYEWGTALTCSETMNEAICRYATLMACNAGEAEAQICFLLCVDHEYSGSFKESLRWIQKANGLWENHSPGVCRNYYLHYEVKLLTEIGKGTIVVDSSQLEAYNERLLELQRRLHSNKISSIVSDTTTTQIPEISNLDDPIMSPTPCPIGSSLGLVQAYDDMEVYREEINKLPEPILQYCLQLSSNTLCDWQRNIIDYEQIRGLLKFTKRFRKVESKTSEWLITWFDLPLAHLYQYRAREFVLAQKIWLEMLHCARNQMGSDQGLLIHGYQIMYDTVSLEQKTQEHAESEDLTAAHALCFWLYFGHYRFQNWTLALKWLREAKRLKVEFCNNEDRNSASKCSEYGYLWKVYYYLLAEADLLVHLVNASQPIREIGLLVHNHGEADRVGEEMASPTGMIMQVSDQVTSTSYLISG